MTLRLSLCGSGSGGSVGLMATAQIRVFDKYTKLVPPKSTIFFSEDCVGFGSLQSAEFQLPSFSQSSDILEWYPKWTSLPNLDSTVGYPFLSRSLHTGGDSGARWEASTVYTTSPVNRCEFWIGWAVCEKIFAVLLVSKPSNLPLRQVTTRTGRRWTSWEEFWGLERCLDRRPDRY